MKTRVSILHQKQIHFQNEEQLDGNFSMVFQALNRWGYCIVNLWDSSETVLTRLRKKLGDAQRHVRSNTVGTVAVCSKASSWEDIIDADKYLGLKSSEHFPHTDGAYLAGFVEKAGVSQWIAPPAYVLLQCVRNSAIGGESIVIDGQSILEDLLRSSPHIARALYEPGCVSFCRDDQLACQVSVYEKLATGRYRQRFRYDKALFVGSKRVRDALRYLHEYYLMNARYRTTLQLQPGQVLVVDNLRMLHGRTSFRDHSEHERLLRRVWVADETLPAAPTSFVENADVSCRAFDRLQMYARLEHPVRESHPPLHPGIYLPGTLEAVLHQQGYEQLPTAC